MNFAMQLLKENLNFLPIMVRETLSRQKLPRVPEQESVMNDEQSVLDYAEAKKSKLFIAYLNALEIVYKVLGNGEGTAIDLACGPGHFTTMIADLFSFEKVTGVDFSENMIDQAHKINEHSIAQKKLNFKVENIFDLASSQSAEHSLSTFTGAAHHFNSIDDLLKIFTIMDDITSPDGLVLIMDLARFKTKSATDSYVRLIGKDYHKIGLPVFYEDFKASQFAAWTPDELRGAIPQKSRRDWIHIVPWFVPFLQVIIGVPCNTKNPFINPSDDWCKHKLAVPEDMLVQWRMSRLLLLHGKKTCLYTKHRTGSEAAWVRH